MIKDELNISIEEKQIMNILKTKSVLEQNDSSYEKIS